MKTRNLFGFLVAVLAILFVLPSVSALVDINAVSVDGVVFNDFGSDPSVAVFAGDTLGVRTTFTADSLGDTEEKVRVTARILGEPGTLVDTEEFAVLPGHTYSRLLNVENPFDLDDEIDDSFVLEVSIESRNGGELASKLINLQIQRESDLVEILAIESQNEVKAGDNAVFDVVVKNRGRQEAEDTFIRVGIPALGISKMVFLGDLDAQEKDDSDREDSALGRVFLKIPRDAPAGVYNVEIEAFNDDASSFASRKVVVVGSGADSQIISSTNSKTFAVSQDETYSVTIVNADNTIRVYELVLEAANGLTVSLDEPIVAVPAGSSKTVALTARAVDEGNFNFAVNVYSDGELVSKQSYVANVEGKTTSAGNAAVVLTIILAIIFVVLLVVLIVLLTRKPEKAEDFGESYY